MNQNQLTFNHCTAPNHSPFHPQLPTAPTHSTEELLGGVSPEGYGEHTRKTIHEYVFVTEGTALWNGGVNGFLSLTDTELQGDIAKTSEKPTFFHLFQRFGVFFILRWADEMQAPLIWIWNLNGSHF